MTWQLRFASRIKIIRKMQPKKTPNGWISYFLVMLATIGIIGILVGIKCSYIWVSNTPISETPNFELASKKIMSSQKSTFKPNQQPSPSSVKPTFEPNQQPSPSSVKPRTKPNYSSAIPKTKPNHDETKHHDSINNTTFMLSSKGVADCMSLSSKGDNNSIHGFKYSFMDSHFDMDLVFFVYDNNSRLSHRSNLSHQKYQLIQQQYHQ